jgi:hypothetical protein
MTTRIAPWSVALILAAGPTAFAAPVPASDPGAAFKPFLTVRTASPEQILSDIRYVTTLIARFAPSDEEAKKFVGGVDQFLDKSFGPDWRKAVDTSKPLFGYLNLDANPAASTGALLIPVKDQPTFRQMVTRLVGKVEEKDGVLQFEMPGERDAEGKPVKAYVRFANQYAYLTYRDPTVLALNRIPTPSQFAGDATAAISAQVFLDRLPDQLKQQALSGVQQTKAMINGGMNGPGMSMIPATWMAMTLMSGPMFQLYPLAEPAVRDGKQVTANLRFDRKSLNLIYDFEVTPVAGSELAKLTAALKPVTSLFPQMFGNDIAAHALVRSTIPEDIRKLIVPQAEAGVPQMQASDPTWGPFAGKIAESLLPSLREGEIDFAAMLSGPGAGDRYGIVAGLRLKDAGNVEKAFRDGVKALPQPLQGMFKLDAATVGGAKAHQIIIPPLPEPAKSIFGDSSVYIAFRPDGVVAAFGDGGSAALQPAITAKPQPMPSVLAEVSGKRLVPLVTKIDAEAGKKFKTFLGTEVDRVPIIEMFLEGGTSLKLRYGNGFVTLLPWFVLGYARVAEAPQAQPAIAVPAAPIK